MPKLNWECKSVKRELALFALKRAIELIESAATTGGSTTSGGSVWYTRAMYAAQHGVDLLRQTDGRRS